MVLYRKSKSIFFLLWAISVFLLCAGSLVNFHQYKIWGKPLNFELVAVKREASKAIIKTTADETGPQGDLTLGSFVLPETLFSPLSAGNTVTFYQGPGFVPVIQTASASGLRAPPTVI